VDQGTSVPFREGECESSEPSFVQNSYEAMTSVEVYIGASPDVRTCV
jgi:hypothetical protein